MRSRSLVMLAALITVCVILPAGSVPVNSVAITILPTGVAKVDYSVSVGNASLLDIQLVGTPLPEYGVVVVDEHGTPLAYMVNETTGTMRIITLGSSLVSISYFTSSILSMSKGVWTVSYVSPLPSTVRLPAGTALSSLSTVPTSVTVQNQSLVLSFQPGRVSFSYVYVPQQPPQQAPPQTSQPSRVNASQPASQPQPTPSPQQPAPAKTTPSGMPIEPLYIAVLGAAGAAVVLALLLKARGGRELGEEDEEIIGVLKKLGGGAFQSDIGLYVSLPPTTLWRRIRRLEKLGYVKIEKKAGRNFVRLVKG
ncbi:helix-turn-helix transcriptional regulator [Thermofilum pendens]|uniref:helix-turn-helix transcriptional regulator n=1 Tax=Thermofilum pendens TaxID=2269 RepID=UPI00069CBD66|nr:hypothetical protein [Thermofilum pendens]